MSFRDLGGGEGGGHASRQQPKQRRTEEESTFERGIKANIREIQECVRNADDQVESARKGFLPRGRGEATETLLERAQGLAQRTEQSFRDWTVHLAGEPFERQRKKLSYEKLYKAFEEEAARLRDVARRQEAAVADSRNREAAAAYQDRASAVAAPSCDEDFELGLLDDSRVPLQQQRQQLEEQAALRSRITQEREEGIRRIQGQVAEVNHFFRDLASIVSDQGHHIETIEQQASVAATSTREAGEELKKAADRQKGARERLCWMIAAAVILMCFLVLPQLPLLGSRGGNSGADDSGTSGVPADFANGFLLAPAVAANSESPVTVHKTGRLTR